MINFVVVDGEESDPYQLVMEDGLAFSPAGKHLAYAAQSHDKWFVVVDGDSGPKYESIGAGTLAWSPNGEHFAYAAIEKGRQCIVLDGHEGPWYEAIGEGQVVPRDDGSIEYLVTIGDAVYRVKQWSGSNRASPQ